MKYRTGLGQDSHPFLPEGSYKSCIGVELIFEDFPRGGVGLTATASNGLAEFGLGEGIQS
jgi:2C-methyl-D-erythritol 2,4-cyclodiphosphate synthase